MTWSLPVFTGSHHNIGPVGGGGGGGGRATTEDNA